MNLPKIKTDVVFEVGLPGDRKTDCRFYTGRKPYVSSAFSERLSHSQWKCFLKWKNSWAYG